MVGIVIRGSSLGFRGAVDAVVVVVLLMMLLLYLFSTAPGSERAIG